MTRAQKYVAPLLLVSGGAVGVLAIAALNPATSFLLFGLAALLVLGGLTAADTTNRGGT